MSESVQELLANARRNQIIDAAAKVFAAKGFHSTTIKDIAREAGIADGTIYNYFDNKHALLIGIFERMQNQLQQADAFTRLDDLDLHEFMIVFLSQPLIAMRKDNFELFRVIVSEMLVNESLRALYYEQILRPMMTAGEQYLQRWAEKRAIKPVDLSLTIRAIAALIMGIMLESIMGDPVIESKWDALPDQLANLLVNGLGMEIN